MTTRKPRKHNPDWADTTRNERTRKRENDLKEKLAAAGWPNKSAFLTAIINGEITVPVNPANQ
jgi:hypothetical protein